MPAPNRILIAAVSLAILTTSCSPTSSAESTTTVPAETTTTQSQASTTLAPSTTTTTRPLDTVNISGDFPPGFASTIDSFLSTVQDPRNDADNVDPELVAHHEGIAGTLAAGYTAEIVVEDLTTGGSVGIVTLDNGDILLLADNGEGGGLNVVGAHLGSVGADPWFGAAPLRVLVLGSDARPGGAAAVHRMDSIHVLTSVPAQGAGTILGWPRDTWVDTPFGEMRVNALTTSGRGPDAIFNHFTEMWEIPLDGYILTAFSGFEKLIAAAVGRLLITLPIPIPEQPWWDAFSSGEQRLTPTRTLDFARTRKKVPGGDFTRSFHQGVVMLAVLTMLQQGSTEDVPVLLGELVKYTETNLTPTDLIQLGAAAFAMDVGEITNEVLPGHLGRAGGGQSVVFLDPEAEAIIVDVVEDGIRDG